jgi:hypothetical protein
MPTYKGNRIGVTVYLTPETFRSIEDSRNPYISSSAYCAMLLDELVGLKK